MMREDRAMKLAIEILAAALLLVCVSAIQRGVCRRQDGPHRPTG